MPRVKKEQAREPLKKRVRLTAAELETVIQYDDASDWATIWCSKKADVEKLKRKRGIKLVEQSKYGARFKIKKTEIQIGTTKRVRKTADRKETKQSSSAVHEKVLGE